MSYTTGEVSLLLNRLEGLQKAVIRLEKEKRDLQERDSIQRSALARIANLPDTHDNPVGSLYDAMDIAGDVLKGVDAE